VTKTRREIRLETIELPTTAAEAPGDRRELRIELRYEEGGMSYFTGQRSPRGYFVGLLPITVKPDGAMSFMLFGSGAQKFLVEPAARFNAKKLAQLVEVAKAHPMYAQCKAGFVVADVTEGGQHVQA
jgi:hypothetical protein